MSDSPIDTLAQTMNVPWDKEDTEYLDSRDKAVTELLAIRPLTLTPDGPVRYMQGGRWKRVHLEDLLAYSLGEKPEKPQVVPINVKLVQAPEPAPLGTSNATPVIVGQLAASKPEAKPPPALTVVIPADPAAAACEAGWTAAEPQPEPDDLLSAPNLLEVARRAYRCASQARQKNGPGPAKEMLYRLYTEMGDAAYCLSWATRKDSSTLATVLPVDMVPDLSKATNAAQDAVQFMSDELLVYANALDHTNAPDPALAFGRALGRLLSVTLDD